MKITVNKFRDITAQLSNIPPALRLIWAASKGWTVAWVLLLVIQGILPAATVYLTRLLIDSLVPVISSNSTWSDITPTLTLAGLMASVVILTQIIKSSVNWVRMAQVSHVQDFLTTLIHQKAVEVDLAFYESPAYHDRLIRARQETGTHSLSLLQNFGSILQSGITLFTLSAFLVPYGVWIPFVLLIGAIPGFIITYRYRQRNYHWWKKTTTDKRWVQYYDTMLTHVVAASELRLFNLGPHFQSAYQRLRVRLRTEELNLARDQSLAQAGTGLLTLLTAGGVMAWMLWQAVQGLATLGDLALFYQSFNRGQSLLASFLNNIGQVYTNSLFLSNLFEFLDQEPQIVDPPVPTNVPKEIEHQIAFHQVSFSYPGSDRVALQNFNLTIPAGQTVAIVGTNGAGKSTLLKLLCRFYDPQNGSITLDGTDIRDFGVQEYRRLVTVLFQDPVPYHATAMHNIKLGDLGTDLDMAQIEAAARSAGAHEIIEQLPQGYETTLGKVYTGGTELSIGEWQRVALARAFARHAPIIILDEPTSALDPWSEADWFDRLQAQAQQRTTILITHRFSTAMRADMIHVMDAGQIVESGTHAELIALNGRYAQSWHIQMQTQGGPADISALNGAVSDQIDLSWHASSDHPQLSEEHNA